MPEKNGSAMGHIPTADTWYVLVLPVLYCCAGFFANHVKSPFFIVTLPHLQFAVFFLLIIQANVTTRHLVVAKQSIGDFQNE